MTQIGEQIFFYAPTLLIAIGAIASAIVLCVSKKLISISLAFFGLYFFTAIMTISLGYELLALYLVFFGILFNVALLSYGPIIVGNLSKSIETVALSGSKKILKIFFILTMCAGFLGISYVMFDMSFVSSGVHGAKSRGIGHVLLGKHIISLQLLGLFCLVGVIGAGLAIRKKS